MSQRLNSIIRQFSVKPAQIKQIAKRVFLYFGCLFLVVNVLEWKILYLPSVDGQFSHNNYPYFKSPQERNLPFEDIEIQHDGVELKGWFIKQQNFQTAPTVVFFHENAGNIGWRLEYAHQYYDRVKCNFVIVAYRGYTYSTGTPHQNGIQKDANAITNYVFNNLKIDKSNVFAHGRSLGGAVATYAFHQRQENAKQTGEMQYKGLIIENSFTQIADVVSNMNSLFKILSPFIMFNTWKTIDLVPKIQNPILFISSGQDEVIPHQQMFRLSQAAQNTSQKFDYHIPHGDHNSNWNYDRNEYFGTIQKFINSTSQL
ncbi:unnamed protein product (macronuclear) [Paramecium tetraurelia]|uniref:Peptidase S9 prolyl oligopeptidase catalytic domain-containing protein n=1 Tax=Paramecium tetraurelia TaxID=5888 RepID=A0DYG1_PARTE|nr:uncharacterized protein GSPATT00003046001 [Paramecium tetraurelia]CAK88078.1 unnamed protein product [Paramecium tetraurelia]|eukprot:XP_001455475.1 hypothetical protein (macronuclear) [Paramecium tetraurelia strain d4-2]